MFKFNEVIRSANGTEACADIYLDPDLKFFKGHFDGQPLMPAAAQILLVNALVTGGTNWNARVQGGEHIKFSRPIEPGDLIKLHLVRTTQTSAQFTLVKQDGSLASKGNVLLAQKNSHANSGRAICGLIPVYNNPMTIERVVNLLRTYIDEVILIDDGSDDGTQLIIDEMAARYPQIHVQHHAQNQGKGAAVQTGLKLAKELGYDDVLQIDADGQHNLEDVPKFLQARQEHPGAMIMGAPIFDESIPAIRKYGRKLTHLMIALEAGSTHLPDAMCGFRLYPVKPILTLGSMSSRMSFDPEVMIRAHWAGVPIKTVATKVRYLSAAEGGVSHFKMVHDNVLHVITHTRLLLQAPLRWVQSWLRT